MLVIIALEVLTMAIVCGAGPLSGMRDLAKISDSDTVPHADSDTNTMATCAEWTKE